ncbi:hypothetical protein Q0Q83_21995 [Escherichia marmotae]|uniref:hypothetical protein n=1 Tax=Escherichia marmotae TaxID=1499973 RepID=UPI002F2EA5DC
MYGGWLLILLPVLTGSGLRGKGLNTVSSAAGAGPDIHHVIKGVVNARRTYTLGVLAPSRSVAQRRGKASFPRHFQYYLVNGVCHIHKHNINKIN